MSEIDDTELREEIIRLETVVEGYSAENRELREENARLTDAMICACEFISPEWEAAQVLQAALKAKTGGEA